MVALFFFVKVFHYSVEIMEAIHAFPLHHNSTTEYPINEVYSGCVGQVVPIDFLHWRQEQLVEL